MSANNPSFLPNNCRLPLPNSTLSFWRTELHELDTHFTETLPSNCDILIVGGGYAGISAAYHLLCTDETKIDPSRKVLLLEAREACSGATARNGTFLPPSSAQPHGYPLTCAGGHLRPSVYTNLSRLIKDFGEADASAVAQFELDHLKAIEDLVHLHDIKCDFQRCRTFDVFTNAKLAAAAKEEFLAFKQSGNCKSTFDDLVWYDGEEAEKISGVKGCVGCFSFPAAQLWPYKLFMHLLSLACDNGLNLQTHTPATSVKYQDGKWKVKTPRGVIHAKKLIVANNAFASTLLPEYTEKIIPIKSICCQLSTPTDSSTPRVAETYGLRLPGRSHDYLIQRPDGKIIVGGARDTHVHEPKEWYDNIDDTTLIEPASHYFDSFMQDHFHGWEDSGAKVDHIWTGTIAYNSDSVPNVGPVPGRENIWIAAGFQGHGMPVIWLTMKGIAKMVGQGARWEESGIPSPYRTTQERLDNPRSALAERVRTIVSEHKKESVRKTAAAEVVELVSNTDEVAQA